MRLDKKNLFLLFICCLAFTLLDPGLHLYFFAPFLIAVIYQKEFWSSLWAALLVGTCLDLLSSQDRFGLLAVNYVLATALIYEQRRHFFGDNLSTLPVMVFLFSIAASTSHAILIYLFERKAFFSWKWLFIDTFGFSFLDAAYAFTLFVLPFYLFGRPMRKGSDYFSR